MDCPLEGGRHVHLQIHTCTLGYDAFGGEGDRLVIEGRTIEISKYNRTHLEACASFHGTFMKLLHISMKSGNNVCFFIFLHRQKTNSHRQQYLGYVQNESKCKGILQLIIIWPLEYIHRAIIRLISFVFSHSGRKNTS